MGKLTKINSHKALIPNGFRAFFCNHIMLTYGYTLMSLFDDSF